MLCKTSIDLTLAPVRSMMNVLACLLGALQGVNIWRRESTSETTRLSVIGARTVDCRPPKYSKRHGLILPNFVGCSYSQGKLDGRRRSCFLDGFRDWSLSGSPRCKLAEVESFPDFEDETTEAWLVDEITTPYNRISVIELHAEADHEFAGAYVLKLDDRDLIHSVFWNDGRIWTGSYYDEFAALPSLLQSLGPIGILGLGAGTVARLLLHAWPLRPLEGWEIDPEVVRVGRAYFGLADLENRTERKPRRMVGSPHNHFPEKSSDQLGGLVVHVGDALEENVRLTGRFAGLIVDLYSNGHICEGLKDPSVWSMLKRRLQLDGRIMVNCGGPPIADEESDPHEIVRLEIERKDWAQGVQSTIAAMATAFDGKICRRELKDDGKNVMLLSGELPDPQIWSLEVPGRLVVGVWDWEPHLKNALEESDNCAIL